MQSQMHWEEFVARFWLQFIGIYGVLQKQPVGLGKFRLQGLDSMFISWILLKFWPVKVCIVYINFGQKSCCDPHINFEFCSKLCIFYVYGRERQTDTTKKKRLGFRVQGLGFRVQGLGFRVGAILEIIFFECRNRLRITRYVLYEKMADSGR